MDLKERTLEALLSSNQYPLYFSLYYAYTNTDDYQRPKESLDERLLDISGNLIMEVITDEELEEDAYDPIDICCYLRSYCFDQFSFFRSALPFFGGVPVQ